MPGGRRMANFWPRKANATSMKPILLEPIGQPVGYSSGWVRLCGPCSWLCGPLSGALGMVEDRWLSVDEIALYLGVKRDTVYKWINRKRMPAHKVGRLWKFRKEDVDQWVRNDGNAQRRGI